MKNLFSRPKSTLEGVELRGTEIIKDLDKIYERNKKEILQKVMKDQSKEKGKEENFHNFKIEVTKHILTDLQKYFVLR